MLKEIETEETIVFFVTFLSLVAFQLVGGAGPLGPPLATPMSSTKLRKFSIPVLIVSLKRTCFLVSTITKWKEFFQLSYKNMSERFQTPATLKSKEITNSKKH